MTETVADSINILSLHTFSLTTVRMISPDFSIVFLDHVTSCDAFCICRACLSCRWALFNLSWLFYSQCGRHCRRTVSSQAIGLEEERVRELVCFAAS